MRDRYGAKNERSMLMRTHVQYAGCSLTEQQPLNNIVRVAYQAMAGVLGGCQSLHTDSMDETLGLPTETAVRVALRTQQILAHETGVHRTVDPLGASWFIEALTDQMEADANRYIKEIDDIGGVVAGVNRGYFRRAIAEASYRCGQEMEAGDRIIVGMNAYTDGNEEQQVEILQIPHAVEDEQCARLAAFRKSRDRDGALRALEDIRTAVRQGKNVMPALVSPAAFDDLVVQHRRTAHALKLYETCEWTLSQLDGDERSDQARNLRHLAQALARQGEFDSRLSEASDLLEAAAIQAEEAAMRIRSTQDDLELDPARLGALEEQLTCLHDLARKHRTDARDLHDKVQALRNEIEQLQAAGSAVAKLDAQLAKLQNQWEAADKQLSAARRASALRFEQAVSEEMSPGL